MYKGLQGFYFWFWSRRLKPQALPGRHQWVWEEPPHRSAPLGSGQDVPGGIKPWVRGKKRGGGWGVEVGSLEKFLWYTDTYKVRRLFAEQPHGCHPLSCCVDVRECLQQGGLARRPLCGRRGTLQRDGSVGHPAAIVILIETRRDDYKTGSFNLCCFLCFCPEKQGNDVPALCWQQSAGLSRWKSPWWRIWSTPPKCWIFGGFLFIKKKNKKDKNLDKPSIHFFLSVSPSLRLESWQESSPVFLGWGWVTQ